MWIIAFSHCLVRKLEIYEKSFKIPDLLFTLQEGRAHKLKCWKTLKPKSEPITWPVSYLLLIPVRRQEILLNYKPPSNFWNMSATFWDLFFALRQEKVDEDWMNNEIQLSTFFNRFLMQRRAYFAISHQVPLPMGANLSASFEPSDCPKLTRSWLQPWTKLPGMIWKCDSTP